VTSAEYEQLVEFLGRQFTEIDHRFDQVGWPDFAGPDSD
jgi:hypothetical protein